MSMGLSAGCCPPTAGRQPGRGTSSRTAPSLPGYGDSGRHGRIGIGLGETLQIPAVPLFLFADAGLVEDSAEDLSFSAVFSDAGIGLDWAFLKAWFPAWVSDPRPGDDCWKMRWRFAFSLWGLVSLLS